MNELIPAERIEKMILSLRGQKVMIDADLAELFGVSTKVLKQAVKRNIDRFPSDFMFELSEDEKSEVVTNCDHLRRLKFSPYLPYAFTEHGILMLANLLNSQRAVQMSLHVVRTFVRLRHLLSSNVELAKNMRSSRKNMTSNSELYFQLFDSCYNLLKSRNGR